MVGNKVVKVSGMKQEQSLGEWWQVVRDERHPGYYRFYVTPMKSGELSKGNQYTELCKHIESKLGCQFDNKCNYAHSIEMLKPVARGKGYKESPCAAFQNGSCRYHTRCFNVHTLNREQLLSLSFTIPQLVDLDDVSPEDCIKSKNACLFDTIWTPSSEERAVNKFSSPGPIILFYQPHTHRLFSDFDIPPQALSMVTPAKEKTKVQL